MKVVRNILIAVIVVEMAGACYFVGGRISRASPPVTDSRRLDPVTIADLENVRVQARDGGCLEWRELAEAFLGNGYYVAAEQCFRYAAGLDSEDLQAVYGRGFCLERIGRTTEAIDVLRQVATHPNANAELARTCWYQIGRNFLREEKGDDAEAAFRRIADFPPAAYQLSKLLIRSGRSDQAIPILEQQLAILPNSLKLLQLRMHAARELGDHDLVRELRDREDRAQYQLVLEYGQSFISMFAQRYGLSAMLSAAMRLKTQGTLADRQTALARALKVIRENQLWQYRSVMIAAAHVEFGLGNLDAVKALLAEIEGYTQGGTDVLELQAMVATAEGRHDVAYRIRSRAAAMGPTSELYRMLSMTEADVDDSVRSQQRAFADLRYAMEAWQSDRIEDAAEALQRTEPILSKNELYLFYRGETQRVSGKPDEAIAAYRKCLEQNPDHGRAIVRIRQLSGD